MLINLNDIKGMRIGASDGEIGKISDIYFDSDHWAVRYLVVETGSWLLSRKVLISPRAVSGLDAVGAVVQVSLTYDQVKNSPNIDTDKPVSRQHEDEFNLYYGYPPYWGGAYLWGGSPYPAMVPPPANLEARQDALHDKQQASGTPNLRSAKEVKGYHIQATDESLGHVEDFLIDDRSWQLRFLIVDTRNWLPGKDVLVDTDSVSAVDWYQRKVHLSIDRSAVENSPEYDENEITERDIHTPQLTRTPARSFWRAHP